MRTIKELLSNPTLVTISTTKATINTQLERVEFESLKNFFEKIDGSWNKTNNAFIFNKNPIAKINDFIENDKMPKSTKKTTAFFPTPTSIVNAMLEEATLSKDSDYVFDNLTFLEPSAGGGAIADEIKDKFLPHHIDLVEYNEDNAELLRDKGYENVFNADFLQYNTNQAKKYDFIIMNPPYLGNAYIKHLNHAYGMLKDNGRLVAVIPNGFITNKDKLSRDFFDLVAFNHSFLTFIKEGFKDTKVTTTIITLKKNTNNEPIHGFSNYKSYNFGLSFTNESKYADKAYDIANSNKIYSKKIAELKPLVESFLNNYSKLSADDYMYSLFPFNCIDTYTKDILNYYGVEDYTENINNKKEVVNNNKCEKPIFKQSSLYDFLSA